jgi:hypothetical protein
MCDLGFVLVALDNVLVWGGGDGDKVLEISLAKQNRFSFREKIEKEEVGMG